MLMAAHADATEIGRALAAVRWSPEVRLRTAVDTVAERITDAVGLDAAVGVCCASTC